jgi:hypothetical protein
MWFDKDGVIVEYLFDDRTTNGIVTFAEHFLKVSFQQRLSVR